MSNEAKERILDKIKKCLALSKSSNPHEAEAALRQARKLMEMHQLEAGDVDASMAEEVRMQATKRPPDWSRMLGSTCAEAFGCTIIITRYYHKTEFCFVGVNGAAELATYAYEVLERQLQHARKDFVGSLSSRCKLTTKRRRGDIFAVSWVNTVHRLIADFSGVNEDAAKAIDAYKAKHFPDLVVDQPYKVRKVSSRDHDAAVAGYRAAKNAKLHRAMSADQRVALTATKSPEKKVLPHENYSLF